MKDSLFLLLFKNRGKVLATSIILREIRGAGYEQDTQALRTLTAGLRRRIEKNLTLIADTSCPVLYCC